MEFLEKSFSEEFMFEAHDSTLVALFGEPPERRPDNVYQRIIPKHPTNAEHVLESVLQLSSMDDGWAEAPKINWVPYGVMFSSHCGTLMPSNSNGYYPLGRDP